jgi:hypothetical protein
MFCWSFAAIAIRMRSILVFGTTRSSMTSSPASIRLCLSSSSLFYFSAFSFISTAAKSFASNLLFSDLSSCFSSYLVASAFCSSFAFFSAFNLSRTWANSDVPKDGLVSVFARATLGSSNSDFSAAFSSSRRFFSAFNFSST